MFGRFSECAREFLPSYLSLLCLRVHHQQDNFSTNNEIKIRKKQKNTMKSTRRNFYGFKIEMWLVSLDSMVRWRFKWKIHNFKPTHSIIIIVIIVIVGI